MTVFANGLEISAKAQGCKVIAEFPDTCFTPPQTPATPPGVPVPYPNFGFDTDLTSGSGTVKIGGKEISQENSSYYSKCSGDEAGCAPKKGVITSNNMGKIYGQKWSMDVKVEGKGVVRFGDISTSNHASDAPDAAPSAFVGVPGKPGFSDTADCLVGQYDEIRKKCGKQQGQAHHIIPDQMLRTANRRTAKRNSRKPPSDPTRKADRRDPSYPTLGEGCAICVGGGATGAPAPAGSRFEGKKGHDRLHQFEGDFGADEGTVTEAVEQAKTSLQDAADADDTTISQDCADIAKECVEVQLAEACAKSPEPTCQVRSPHSENAIANRVARLGGVSG